MSAQLTDSWAHFSIGLLHAALLPENVDRVAFKTPQQVFVDLDAAIFAFSDISGRDDELAAMALLQTALITFQAFCDLYPQQLAAFEVNVTLRAKERG